MSGERLRTVAAAGLVIGAVLGMAGSFAPSAELRSFAWAVDGVALVVGSALLAASKSLGHSIPRRRTG